MSKQIVGAREAQLRAMREQAAKDDAARKPAKPVKQKEKSDEQQD